MSVFYVSHFRFLRPSLSRPLRFVVLSDLHFSAAFKNSLAQALVKFTQDKKPDYILFTGDFLDSLGVLTQDRTKALFRQLIGQLASIAPSYGILGNHDFYWPKNLNSKGNIFKLNSQWSFESPDLILEALSNIPNFKLLDNASFKTNELNITGITLPPKYYFGKPEYRVEDPLFLADYLGSLPTELIRPSTKTLNLALLHSPINLKDPEVKPYLKNFDYLLAGHLHNGLLPPAIIDLWPSTRGLMGPGKRLLVKDSHNVRIRKKDKLLVMGAITTIHASARPVSWLDKAYPACVAVIDFKNREPSHGLKSPRLTRRYHTVF